jgi:hypothetical protein
MSKTLIVDSQETGRTGILPVCLMHRQDSYAPGAGHLLVCAEYAYLSSIRPCPTASRSQNGNTFIDHPTITITSDLL